MWNTIKRRNWLLLILCLSVRVLTGFRTYVAPSETKPEILDVSNYKLWLIK